MTQAPTPGPLSGDDVKLLVKLLDTLKPFAEVAEKLKHCHVVEICEPTPDNPSRNIIPMPREWFERAGDDLEYIAIQLHASGVLSEGQASKITGLDRVSVRREVDRLAPTAPVEASGSEWEHGPKCWGKTSFSDEMMYCYCGSTENRPQPSGETRETVALQVFADEVAKTGVTEDTSGDDAYNALTVIVEYARKLSSARPDPDEADGDLNGRLFRDPIQAADALLSARPLALGGQQGEEAAWSWLNRHVECDPADSDYSADEMVDAFMAGAGRYDIWLKALERIAGEQQHRSGYCQTDITVEPALTAEEAQTVARDALSTTPARAEAQDEGAAGEPWGYAARRVRIDGSACEAPWTPGKIGDGFYMLTVDDPDWEITTLYAHPSPTPAADADRVREAIADVISHESDWRTALTAMDAAEETPEDGSGKPGYWLHQIKVLDRILAALKSTAAKEGGAK